MSGKKTIAKPRRDFHFIISNGQRGPEDPNVRTLIRKQAMRDVGLARRRKTTSDEASNFEEDPTGFVINQVGTPCEIPIRSSPETTEISFSQSSTDESSENEYWSDGPDTIDISTSPVTSAIMALSSPLSYSGYEKARARFHIEIGDLSALTSFHMGKSVIPILSTNLERLVSLLDVKQWSYLDYIPARYDSSPCLAAATDCVMAKLVNVLSPSAKNDRISWALYAKALKSIQSSISDSVARTEPEVLCAIHLLSLHELLDVDRGDAWSQHIVGSARLIKYRSPDKFKTEFEKALLAAHAGAIVSEAILVDQSCYLDQPEWTQVLYTLGAETESLTERSPLILNIRIKMLALPGLWSDLGKFMNSERLFDDEAHAKMTDRCREAHANYLQWLDDYNAHCVRTSFSPTSSDELKIRREAFGTVCECLLLMKRFWACLADEKRLALELESHALAKLIVELQTAGDAKLSWLCTTHEIEMAEAVFATQHLFEEDSSGLSAFEKRLASRKRYNALSQHMRGS